MKRDCAAGFEPPTHPVEGLREPVHHVLDLLVVVDVVVAEHVLEDDGHQLRHVLLQDGLSDPILGGFI